MKLGRKSATVFSVLSSVLGIYGAQYAYLGRWSWVAVRLLVLLLAFFLSHSLRSFVPYAEYMAGR